VSEDEPPEEPEPAPPEEPQTSVHEQPIAPEPAEAEGSDNRPNGP
jgi:hypothetical protein